jgi:hypothetical protein
MPTGQLLARPLTEPLALQMQRAAEIRCSLPWARIAHELGR